MLLSFLLTRVYPCWLSALQFHLPVLGQCSRNFSSGLRMLRDAIWSTSPFLPWKSTPISSTEFPLFVSTGSENPNLGTYKRALRGYLLRHSWLQGGEPGKLAPVSSSVLDCLVITLELPILHSSYPSLLWPVSSYGL